MKIGQGRVGPSLCSTQTLITDKDFIKIDPVQDTGSMLVADSKTEDFILDTDSIKGLNQAQTTAQPLVLVSVTPN